jgi:hypothetical protein
VIGLAFIASVLYASSDPSIRLKAKLEADSTGPHPRDVLFTMSVVPWNGRPASDGGLQADVRLPIRWRVEVTAPGFDPVVHEVPSPPLFKSADIGSVLLRQLEEQPLPKPRNIVPAPANLPPFNPDIF